MLAAFLNLFFVMFGNSLSPGKYMHFYTAAKCVTKWCVLRVPMHTSLAEEGGKPCSSESDTDQSHCETCDETLFKTHLHNPVTTIFLQNAKGLLGWLFPEVNFNLKEQQFANHCTHHVGLQFRLLCDLRRFHYLLWNWVWMKLAATSEFVCLKANVRYRSLS